MHTHTLTHTHFIQTHLSVLQDPPLLIGYPCAELIAARRRGSPPAPPPAGPTQWKITGWSLHARTHARTHARARADARTHARARASVRVQARRAHASASARASEDTDARTQARALLPLDAPSVRTRAGALVEVVGVGIDAEEAYEREELADTVLRQVASGWYQSQPTRARARTHTHTHTLYGLPARSG